MKSYADYALAVYGGIISDATTRWPSLGSSMEKDLSYLRRAVESRGLPFLTIVLPDTGKWFDKSLDYGSQLLSGIPQGMPSKHGRPKLFRDLLSLVFDDEGVLRTDADVEAILFLRSLYGAMKKLEVPYTPQTLEESLDEFFEIERRLAPHHPHTWESDLPVWAERVGHPIWGVQTPPTGQYELLPTDLRDAPSLPWHTLRAVARRVVGEIGIPNWWGILPKHGPGAVSQTGRGIFKYEFHNWPRQLEAVFPFDWFGSGLLEPNDRVDSREIPSRLIAVPKSQKGPRLICAEPIANQWIQQGISRWLEERIEGTILRHSISLRSQEHSRERALTASIDGKEATIDLSAASDRISTRLVEYLFQGSEILDGMHACRTRLMVQNISQKHDSHLVLRKFSTMGSALTFPIQSIIFTILSVWALRLHEGTHLDLDGIVGDFQRVRVYGDDIIAPTHAIETIKLVLHECGLLVNASKSYSGENFRESCGCDAFKGVDVTPPRCKHPYDGSPALLATHLETSNNYHRKGFWKTAQVLVSMIPESERKLLLVHRGEGLGLGLFSFVGPSISHLRKKWDSALQREYSIALGVTSRVTFEQGPGMSGLTQYFTECPDPNPLSESFAPGWRSGRPGRVRLRKERTRVYH